MKSSCIFRINALAQPTPETSLDVKDDFVLKKNHTYTICSLPFVICDPTWDLRGLQKAGGSCRVHDCDCIEENQLAVNDLHVSFCFLQSAMRQSLRRH